MGIKPNNVINHAVLTAKKSINHPKNTVDKPTPIAHFLGYQFLIMVTNLLRIQS
jgi:hypothetical protein